MVSLGASVIMLAPRFGQLIPYNKASVYVMY